MSHDVRWEGSLALEMGRHHVRIHGLVERRRAIAFLLIIVIAPVEVRRALVFGGAAVL